jgi:hypothetical protein
MRTLVHHRHTVIAQSDLSVVDPDNRTHVGTLNMGANGWWAGYSLGKQWRGLYDPVTGAWISRRNGGRNRSKAECPPGWVIEQAPPLTNFLWFIGRGDIEARQSLVPSIQVLIRQSAYPVWRRPEDVSRGTPRAYSFKDKVPRAAEIAW